MTLEETFKILFGGKDEKEVMGFLKFLVKKEWKAYNDYLMDELQAAASKINWDIRIPNAKEGQEYNQTVDVSRLSEQLVLESVTGLTEAEHGLKLIVADDKRSFSIKGTPDLEHFRTGDGIAPSTFELCLFYRFSGIEMPDSRPRLEHRLPFIINQDSQKLFKNFPVAWDKMDASLRYENKDTQCEYVLVASLADGTPQKDIVAASKRGRSHAQDGKPRDDDFKIRHLKNGWYVMAVADGAGSAKYSREGSRIACDVACNYCEDALKGGGCFEEHIMAYKGHKDEEAKRKAVGDDLYKILGNAALQAHRNIKEEAEGKKIEPKQYATTLLLSITKRFAMGWFVAAFWVGDGAICLYDKRNRIAKILGIPDEGEYAGQTRFLTMPEIFKDPASVYQRLRFEIVDDFTALFLMTDGVSDPKFETDKNLESIDKWDALWEDLKSNGVELKKGNEAAKDQLLDWLDFWAKGHHDDRTIAILYGGNDGEDPLSQDGGAGQECLAEPLEGASSNNGDAHADEMEACGEHCQGGVEKTTPADGKTEEDEAIAPKAPKADAAQGCTEADEKEFESADDCDALAEDANKGI